MEREEERRKKTEKIARTRAIGSKVKQHKGTQATTAIASSLAKEVGDSSTVGSYKACSNERSKKNEHNNGMPKSVDRVYTMQPICYRDKWEEYKLLQLWEIWILS